MRLAVLVLLVFSTVVAAQADKAKELIIGKWVAELPKDTPKEVAEMAPVIEFKKDGGLAISVGPINIMGTYKFLTDDQLQVELDLKGEKKTQKLKVEVTKDTLTTTDEKSKVEKFKRKN